MFLLRPLLLIGAGALGASYLMGTSPVDSSPGKPCAFQVTADKLNIRAAPGAAADRVGSLAGGEQVTATPSVVDGFRDLGDARWVSAEFLAPMPGSSCP